MTWDAWKDKAWSAGASFVLTSAKKVETQAWRTFEPVGQWTNKTAGRFGLESFYPTTLDKEVDKCARIIRTFTEPAKDEHGNEIQADFHDGDVVDEYADRKKQSVLYKIPPKILQSARGVAVFTVFRSGLGFSGAGGSGVVLTKDENGEWGGPSGILVHTVGWGLMVGVDVVLVLRNQRAVDAFKYPKISVGGELTVSAGPVGNGAIVDAGVEASPCLSYVKSKGFYAGVQFDGSIFLTRTDENARFYNYPDIPVAKILDSQLPRHQLPRECMPLWQALCAGEGRPQHLGVDAIPMEPAPGDHEVTKDEMALLQQQQEDKSGSTPMPPPPRRNVPPTTGATTAEAPSKTQEAGAHPVATAVVAPGEAPPPYEATDLPSSTGATTSSASAQAGAPANGVLPPPQRRAP